MSLKKMEIQLNIQKMETGIMEKLYQKEKLKEDMQRIDDHIESMKKHKEKLVEELSLL